MSYNRDMPTGNCQKCINTYGTLGCCDTISNEWRYNCAEGMRLFDERKPKTNADRIRAMSDEELTEWVKLMVCKYRSCGNCPMSDWCEPDKGIAEWLKAPAEEQE